MELEKGYAKKNVENNIEKLKLKGHSMTVAISIAVSYARGLFKRERPEISTFPPHLAPGAITQTYWKDGGDNGEE